MPKHSVSAFLHAVEQKVIETVIHWLDPMYPSELAEYDAKIKQQHTSQPYLSADTHVESPIPPSQEKSDHDRLSHSSTHSAQLLKTADPFLEGSLLNIDLLIDDMMHHLPWYVERNNMTRQQLSKLLHQLVEERHRSANPKSTNYKASHFILQRVTRYLRENDLALEEDNVPSFKDTTVKQKDNFCNLSEYNVMKDRKYWQRLMIAKQLKEFSHKPERKY